MEDRKDAPVQIVQFQGLQQLSTTGHDERRHLDTLRHLPDAMSKVLALEPQIMAWSETLTRKENSLFLGRGMHFPIALEGAP